jgi:hypothetical protein
MPEYEITFKMRFRLRDDQKPEEVAEMYLRSMGFEFVSSKLVEEKNDQPHNT